VSKKIFIVLTRLGGGGAERQAYYLSKELINRGWDITLISILQARPDFQLPSGAKFIDFGYKNTKHSLLAYFRVIKVINDNKPSVILVMTIPADVIIRLTAPLHNAKIISSIRNENIGSKWREYFLRLTDKFIDALTTNSMTAKNNICSRISSKDRETIYIGNYFDIDAWQNSVTLKKSEVRKNLKLELNDFVWISIGSQNPKKNYPTIIKAFSKTTKSKLLIVGTHRESLGLREIALKYGVADRILFLGRRTDVPNLINASDAFILASFYEGTPNSLVEAAALKLPIVSSNVGAVSEIIQNGESGFLIDPNDIDIISDKMKIVESLNNSDVKSITNRAMYVIREKFDNNKVIDKWESVMLNLIK